MSVINVILNAENFTVEHDSIVRDHAFGDLSYYFDSSDNEFLVLKFRISDKSKYVFHSIDDTIDIDGTTSFANAQEIALALDNVIFS